MSERDHRIFALRAQGKTYCEIGNLLNVSPLVVKNVVLMKSPQRDGRSPCPECEEIMRRDFEREIYARCDREDSEGQREGSV